MTTDEFTDPDDTGGQTGETPQMGQLRKQLKDAQKQAKENAEAAKRAEAAERRLAFAEAGINLSDKRAGLFIKGYDGELEADKVKAAWTDYFGATDQPDPAKEAAQREAEQKQQQELQDFGKMEAAVAGTPLPGAGQAELLQGMHEVFQKGGDADDVARYLGQHGYPVAPGYE
jgi:hypothetical protein